MNNYKSLPGKLLPLNDQTLEELHLPSDALAGTSYLVLENLPNLKKISIARKPGSDSYPVRDSLLSLLGVDDDIDLKWLYCRNLPALESIDVDGGLFWLQVQNTPELRTLNLAKANKLAYLHIEHARSLSKISIGQCVKLPGVQGIGAVQRHQLKVDAAINRIQKSNSKFDGTVYANMTVSDVNFVLDIFNRGWAEAATRGLLGPVYEGEAANYQKMPGFNRWSFRVMEPLDFTDTRGSGMTATYEVISKSFDSDYVTSWGATSAEECLYEVWQDMGNSKLAERFNTLPKMLKKLRALIC